MNYVPEIFFDYKIDINASALNTVDDFVLYTTPCESCETICSHIVNGLMAAFFIRMDILNPVQAKKFIAYHYHAYKGDKIDFILGLRNLLPIISDFTPKKEQVVVFCAAYLNEKEQELNQAKQADITPIYNAPSNNIKLTWNGQSNALIDMFRQLKTMVNSKNEPLLANPYDEIATFLISNFTNFENVKNSTVRRQLKENNLVKKTEKRITIECKAPDSNES
jgi:hypothetical protein